jgi:streptogramin lyase
MDASMTFWRRPTGLALCAATVAWLGAATLAQNGQNPTMSGVLSGRVTADRGEVRAFRVAAKDTLHKITYTVFTRGGQYQIFNLPASTYEISVIEDAFDSPVQKVDVKAGQTQTADLALKAKPGPLLADVPGGKQRPNAELVDWETMYPPSPARDIMVKDCLGCHSWQGFHRRGGKTEAQWRNAIERMFDNKAWGRAIGIEGAPLLDYQLPNADRDLIAKYLATNFPLGGKVRDLKLDPNPRDEAALAEAIYVTYELPAVQGAPFADGTKREPGFHDAQPGGDPETLGTVWLSGTPNSSIWQVDVRNPLTTPEQRTKQFQIPSPENINIRPHGIFEFKGHVWTSNIGDSGATDFNYKTREFKRYLPVESKGSSGLTVVVDSKGIVWWANNMGHTRIVRLDPKSGKITEYNPVPGAGWYGMAVDKKDRVVATGYGRGFEVPVWDPKTEKFNLFKLNNTSRRPTVDSKGIIWTAQYFGNSMGRINADSGTTSEVKLPLRYGNVYEVSADSQDNIWGENQNYNSLVRYDQKTNTFTYFPFPILKGHTPRINRDVKNDAWFELDGQVAVFRPNGNKAAGRTNSTARAN